MIQVFVIIVTEYVDNCQILKFHLFPIDTQLISMSLCKNVFLPKLPVSLFYDYEEYLLREVMNFLLPPKSPLAVTFKLKHLHYYKICIMQMISLFTI